MGLTGSLTAAVGLAFSRRKRLICSLGAHDAAGGVEFGDAGVEEADTLIELSLGHGFAGEEEEGMSHDDGGGLRAEGGRFGGDADEGEVGADVEAGCVDAERSM